MFIGRYKHNMAPGIDHMKLLCNGKTVDHILQFNVQKVQVAIRMLACVAEYLFSLGRA